MPQTTLFSLYLIENGLGEHPVFLALVSSSFSWWVRLEQKTLDALPGYFWLRLYEILDQFSFLGNRARYVNRPRFVDTELEASHFSGGTK